MPNRSRLEPHGSVFVFVSDGADAPRSLKYQGRTLIRYMDRIFLPRRPSELSREEVHDANEVRLLLGAEVIDTRFTQQTLSDIYRRATRTGAGIRVLDFGCGDGNITAQILKLPRTRRPAEVVGIDICQYAVRRAHERLTAANCGTAILVGDNGTFELASSYFDAVIANFVLHFPLSHDHANELFRVLTPHGRLVYNDYMHQRDGEHFVRVMSTLREVGFRVQPAIQRFGRLIGDRMVTVEQAIVECVKPGPE